MDEIQFPDTPFHLKESLVLLGRRGSEAHGTFIPTEDPNGIDDRDLMGICIPPVDWTLGLKVWEHAEAIKGPWDVVLYDFRKFVRLLVKQNPNVIGMLWLEQEDYLHLTNAGRWIIEARDLFRCKMDAFESFSGYAFSQLKKMEGGAFLGYMGAKRKELVEKHGYDTKNAAHLIRLLHMGTEYQLSGRLTVRRTWDREMLIEIKRGKWSLFRVKDYAEQRFASMRAALKESALPEKIDLEAVNELVVRCMATYL